MLFDVISFAFAGERKWRRKRRKEMKEQEVSGDRYVLGSIPRCEGNIDISRREIFTIRADNYYSCLLLVQTLINENVHY